MRTNSGNINRQRSFGGKTEISLFYHWRGRRRPADRRKITERRAEQAAAAGPNVNLWQQLPCRTGEMAPCDKPATAARLRVWLANWGYGNTPQALKAPDQLAADHAGHPGQPCWLLIDIGIAENTAQT